MFGKKPKNQPTNEENSTLDGLLSYEAEIEQRLETETDPAKYLAHSDALRRVRRARHGLELSIFGGAK